jgi:hypothetical protein
MKNGPSVLILALTVGFLGQGCVAWRYVDTPPASGAVIDATTKQPISGAKVGFRKHKRIDNSTASDGSFYVRPSYVWRPCFILPAELGWCGGLFFAEAAGYTPFEQVVTQRQGFPFTISPSIALKRDSE